MSIEIVNENAPAAAGVTVTTNVAEFVPPAGMGEAGVKAPYATPQFTGVPDVLIDAMFSAAKVERF
ncbi:MAG: hypothetical protein KBG84_04305 [Planctomycetes bacterium]|nr:hypothetical protein [Planctomycetota bacterium]